MGVILSVPICLAPAVGLGLQHPPHLVVVVTAYMSSPQHHPSAPVSPIWLQIDRWRDPSWAAPTKQSHGFANPPPYNRYPHILLSSRASEISPSQPLHGARNCPRSIPWASPPISGERVKKYNSHVVPFPAAGARLLSYLSPFQADISSLYWHHGVGPFEDPDA